jgi:hypothetical protein
MIEVLSESHIITMIAVLFTSTWAYRQGQRSRQSEINFLRQSAFYYRNLSRELALQERNSE